MLSVHNSSSDKTCLVYVASSFDIASTSKTVFVKPTVPEPQIAYVDKDKGITGGEINVSVEPVKSSLNKKSLPTLSLWHQRSHPTQLSTASCS